MTVDATCQAIHNIVVSYLPQARVLLFGSRAKGTFTKHSDYDIMIVTPDGITKQDRKDAYGNINKDLAWDLNIASDILLFTEQEVEIKKELPGHIVRTACREGINI